MLPTGSGPEGYIRPAVASRRMLSVMESLISRQGLNLRLASAIAQAFEGAELKGSDYAAEHHMSKESGGRELRQPVDAGLLQTVKYAQAEAGFKASQDLLRTVAQGLRIPVNASTPLPAPPTL